jgi:hypothetical protein
MSAITPAKSSPRLSLPRRLAVTVVGVALGGLAACNDAPTLPDGAPSCPCYCVAVDGGNPQTCSNAALVDEANQCPSGCEAVHQEA